MTLWLVRHAQPLIPHGICYGQLDIQADPIATQQVANNLAALLPLKARLYSSSLQRARQLSQALKERRKDLSLTFDARLNEMAFGTWEGVAWDAIPKAAFDAWTADFDTHRFGGAQSLHEVLVRVGQALNTVDLTQDVIWVTHAGVIRAVNYLLEYGARTTVTVKRWPTTAPGFGEWQCIEIDRSNPFFTGHPKVFTND